jgi:hypothetical protein
MSNITNKHIMDHIVQNDPRFAGFTDNGGYVLRMENADEIVTEVEMTPEEFADTCFVRVEERFFAVSDMTMAAISGTNTTLSSAMIDVLLDLRALFIEEREEHRATQRRWYDAFKQVAAYNRRYGWLDPDVDDEPDTDDD